MPVASRILTKNNIDANNDVFQPSAEQLAYIKTNYIDTGKITERTVISSGVLSSPSGFSTNKIEFRENFVDAAAYTEYINDPVVLEIRANANAFYANSGIEVSRAGNFDDVEFGTNPPAQPE